MEETSQTDDILDGIALPELKVEMNQEIMMKVSFD